jgi:hypothetical protein
MIERDWTPTDRADEEDDRLHREWWRKALKLEGEDPWWHEDGPGEDSEED